MQQERCQVWDNDMSICHHCYKISYEFSFHLKGIVKFAIRCLEETCCCLCLVVWFPVNQIIFDQLCLWTFCSRSLSLYFSPSWCFQDWLFRIFSCAAHVMNKISMYLTDMIDLSGVLYPGYDYTSNFPVLICVADYVVYWILLLSAFTCWTFRTAFRAVFTKIGGFCDVRPLFSVFILLLTELLQCSLLYIFLFSGGDDVSTATKDLLLLIVVSLLLLLLLKLVDVPILLYYGAQ